MESKFCTKCSTLRTGDEWYASQHAVSGWCKACMRAYYKAKNAPDGYVFGIRECAQCKRGFEPRLQQNRVKFCSRECKTLARNEKSRRDILARKQSPRQCIQCGGSMPTSMRVDAKFCSAECNSAAHQLKRKLRNRGKTASDGYVRIEIAERDGWSCGICDGPIDRALRYPDPDCLSLDHIVPVSRGGSSEPENLQASHWICNVRRRDSELERSAA